MQARGGWRAGRLERVAGEEEIAEDMGRFNAGGF
jgi:hypothetical protein